MIGGRARCVAVATGARTELGRIAGLTREGERPTTPLRRRLARFGQRLFAAIVVICAVIFVAGLLRGEPPLLMLLTAVSLAIAAIPEALPAVVTIGLALGAKRMAGRNALVRRLPAVEPLGSVTVICCDKTGTLTQNVMRAERFLSPRVTQAGCLPPATRTDSGARSVEPLRSTMTPRPTPSAGFRAIRPRSPCSRRRKPPASRARSWNSAGAASRTSPSMRGAGA